jgi:C4-dicarboxylate-specific signal transduction histidine kinase
MYRFAFAALLLTLGFYAVAILSDEVIDLSEFLSSLHALTEEREIDELLIGLLVVGVALLVDFSRNLKRTWNALEVEHRELERSHAELVVRKAELEQANAALREAQAQLVEMERLAVVRDMVVSLHHEILNPLTGVLGAIELLRDNGAAQTDKTRILDCAEQAAHRIGRLIKGLPDLESLERTAYVGGTTMIDLGKLRAGAEEYPGSQARRNRATSAS